MISSRKSRSRVAILVATSTLVVHPAWAQGTTASLTLSSEALTTPTLTADSVTTGAQISPAFLFTDSLSPLSTTTLSSADILGSSFVPTTNSIAPNQEARSIAEIPDLEEFKRSLTSARRPTVRVSAQSVVARTIQKNLSIRLRQIQTARSSDEVHVQQGIFDLTVRGLVSALRDESPTDLRDRNLSGSIPIRRTTAASVEGGLDQLLSTGGTLSLDVANDRTETNASGNVSSPLEEANASLSLRQPLLQGAGPFVTRSRITIAQLGERASLSQLRAQLLSEISTSLQLYYDLVFAVSNVEVLQVSLAQAEELLRVNTAKYNAGVLPELDVLQAQADVASRLQDVIVALQQVEQASDRLRLQLAEIGDKRDVSLRPADKATVPSVTVNEKAAISTAMAKRPEMEITALSIEQSNIQVGVSENATLPRLDAQVGVGFAGANVGTRGAFSDLYDREGSSWNAGLAFSYPLQNRSARGRLSQSRRDLEIATIERQQIRDQILLDVRNAIRAVETNRQKVAVGRATVEFNLAKVDSGQKRQQVGLATSFDVLAFQRDLANARSQLIQSVVDLNKSLIQLEQAKGTLLDRMGVEMRRPNRSRTKASATPTATPQVRSARSRNN